MNPDGVDFVRHEHPLATLLLIFVAVILTCAVFMLAAVRIGA